MVQNTKRRRNSECQLKMETKLIPKYKFSKSNLESQFIIQKLLPDQFLSFNIWLFSSEVKIKLTQIKMWTESKKPKIPNMKNIKQVNCSNTKLMQSFYNFHNRIVHLY